MPTSYNGYTVLKPDSDMLRLWKVPMTGDDRHFRARKGAPGFLLAAFALSFHRMIEPINKGEWDDWGHDYREVRGASVWSCHASGTAIDLNAVDHPLGAVRTFKHAWQYTKLRWLLNVRFRGCIKWGGDFSSRKDEMHFEIIAPMRKCVRVANRIRKHTRVGKTIAKANPPIKY